MLLLRPMKFGQKSVGSVYFEGPLTFPYIDSFLNAVKLKQNQSQSYLPTELQNFKLIAQFTKTQSCKKKV